MPSLPVEFGGIGFASLRETTLGEAIATMLMTGLFLSLGAILAAGIVRFGVDGPRPPCC
jgi:hypothetical protein